MRLPNVLFATVTAAALIATSACTKVVSGSATLNAGAPTTPGTDCKSVSAPLTSIDPHEGAEPQLKIPQPSGWERAARLDSDVIRFTMGNKSLTARSFMPTVVVTLEAIPGGHADAQAIFDQERTALVKRLGARGLHASDTTLCGSKAELVDYSAPAMGRKIPPRKARTLMVAAGFGDTTYVATVTVQSTDPTNPGYVQDSDTILSGFQMLPPEGS